jgi:hypothetical protein
MHYCYYSNNSIVPNYSLDNLVMVTEYWYDTYWKPWLSWAPQQQQDNDREKVE